MNTFDASRRSKPRRPQFGLWHLMLIMPLFALASAYYRQAHLVMGPGGAIFPTFMVWLSLVLLGKVGLDTVRAWRRKSE